MMFRIKSSARASWLPSKDAPIRTSLSIRSRSSCVRGGPDPGPGNGRTWGDAINNNRTDVGRYIGAGMDRASWSRCRATPALRNALVPNRARIASPYHTLNGLCHPKTRKKNPRYDVEKGGEGETKEKGERGKEGGPSKPTTRFSACSRLTRSPCWTCGAAGGMTGRDGSGEQGTLLLLIIFQISLQKMGAGGQKSGPAGDPDLAAGSWPHRAGLRPPRDLRLGAARPKISSSFL